MPPVVPTSTDPGMRSRLCSAAFVSGGPTGRWSNWTIHAGRPALTLTCHPDGRCTLEQDGRVTDRWPDPISGLRHLAGTVGHDPQPLPFTGGWCGFLSYDLGRWFEPDCFDLSPKSDLPLFVFQRHESAHVTHRADGWASQVGGRWPDFRPRVAPRRPLPAEPSVERATSADRFRDGVARVVEYVRAGDVFQANLAQRLRLRGDFDPQTVWDAVQAAHPSWYSARLDCAGFSLLSNSPELFLDVEPRPDGSRLVTTRPIKGTRPPHPNKPDMAADLLASEKDAAELNMIVDLQRNDLGRVCEVGSVRVSEPRHVEDHGSVLHGVAGVTGTLRPDVDLVGLLAATFPPGSITGAPKIRAMQIIDELEPVARGPYCGAIGFLSDSGHVSLNVAIRTLVVRDDHVDLHVGAGIVADSDPAAEHDETIDKAAAWLRVLNADPATLR